MAPKTERGKMRRLTSGDGRKNIETDVKRDMEETEEMIESDY